LSNLAEPAERVLNAPFPEKLAPLFEPHRYKVIVGGRGKGASWGIARALLILGYQRTLRWLCTREVQKTIADSVHQLLKDQIALLGLGAFYSATDSAIVGLNGTRFAFTGLHNLTAENLKSYEGFDGAWVAEAKSTSKKSWSILIPTIRKDGSEIWVDLNPEMDSDDTYVRFVVNTPPDCALIRMGWRDNPWFPPVLEKERKYLEEHDPESYKNIWDGKCRSSVDGAIYAGEIRDAIEQRRIRPVPYDAMLKVHTIWDLGWNDRMSVVFAQRAASEIRVIDFIEDQFKTYDWYAAEIKNRRYNLGRAFLPHDGAAKSAQTGLSAVEILKKLGLDCASPLPPTPVEEGIKALRQTFSRIFFDETKTAPLIDHLKRYKRSIPSTTNEARSPVHDEHSHAADAMRYLAMCAEQMRNDEKDKALPMVATGIV